LSLTSVASVTLSKSQRLVTDRSVLINGTNLPPENTSGLLPLIGARVLRSVPVPQDGVRLKYVGKTGGMIQGQSSGRCAVSLDRLGFVPSTPGDEHLGIALVRRFSWGHSSAKSRCIAASVVQ
jgi:hypothetical protein